MSTPVFLENGSEDIPEVVASTGSMPSFHPSSSSSKDLASKDDNMPKLQSGTVTLDIQEMKKAVAQALEKPVYDVRDYYREEGIWPLIAKHPYFENFTLGVITFNALWISIDTDGNHANSTLEADPIYQIAEHGFCIFFTFEWYIRYKSFRRIKDGMRDSWFAFDTALVFMMVVETWVMGIVLIVSGAGVSAGGVASLLRLLRLLRLSRLARMLRSIPELMILIRGMLASMRSVFFTLCLLFIIMYVFAIMFRQLTNKSLIGEKYFATIPDAMYTLLITGTFLDNLLNVANDLGDASLVYVGIFFVFVLLAALTVLNMLVGVLCDVVSNVSATEKEESSKSLVKQKMERIMEEIDENGDGTISKSEFNAILENVEAINALQEVGVDPVGLSDFQDYIFESDPQVFSAGERIVDAHGRCGCVDSGPYGMIYRVVFDGCQPSNISEVSKNCLYKVLDPGSRVKLEGNAEGLIKSGPDDQGRYTVAVTNGSVPTLVHASPPDITVDADVELTREDFLEVVLKFRGSNTATIRDMVDIRKFIRSKLYDFEEKLLGGRNGLSARSGGSSDEESLPAVYALLEGALDYVLWELQMLSSNLDEDAAWRNRPCTRRGDPSSSELRRVSNGSGSGHARRVFIAGDTDEAHHLDEEDRSAADIESSLVKLEEIRSQVLAVVQRVRRLLMRDLSSPCRVGGQPRLKSTSSPSSSQRTLRLFLARLESFFLTYWPEELQGAWGLVASVASTGGSWRRPKEEPSNTSAAFGMRKVAKALHIKRDELKGILGQALDGA